jgi:hypothetical protein
LTLSATGTLSGTPTTTGSYNFTVTATDKYSCTGSKSYTINICPSITLSPSSLPSGTVGTSYSQTITASGGSAPYFYAVTSGSLPDGLVLDTTKGTLSGTPTASGSFKFTVTATDKNSCQGTQSYTIVIACRTITLTPTSLPDGTVATAYTQTITASGGKSPYTFAVTSGALPTGLTVGGATGVISGTPTTAGTSTFTITATDADKCIGSASYTLKVVSNCPTITIAPATLPDAKVSIAYNQTVSASGGTAPYVYTVSSGFLPIGLSLNSSTGAISGTPTTKGSYTFEIKAVDSKGCFGTKQYTMSVTVNPPVITSVTKMTNPFRLKVLGGNFHYGCVVQINGQEVSTTYKSSNKIIAKKGDILKVLLPKNVPVQITVLNKDDGGVSDPVTFVR